MARRIDRKKFKLHWGSKNATRWGINRKRDEIFGPCSRPKYSKSRMRWYFKEYY
jgi:hypothetical protein